MKTQLLHPADYRTTDWSGGSTTELFLYPPGADYAARNFLFRISSATVNESPSDFTLLPGFERYLMILGGELSLKFDALAPVKLAAFDSVSFPGGIRTVSAGTGRDFNLMVAEGHGGSLLAIQPGETHALSGESSPDFVLLHAPLGAAELAIGGVHHTLGEGDSLLLSELPARLQVTNKSEQPVICCSTTLKKTL
ncbi:HutD/Ves family protein [Feifania hominis]|uniref:HutD family protein n=1 Tax=Feifania hominis TaxID=2763660 RepID=A0A926HUA9_9FIRM|nr:HutD family protein [Feifania hominis]MBC8535356.1 HutD family protein [Feifania hominis]